MVDATGDRPSPVAVQRCTVLPIPIVLEHISSRARFASRSHGANHVAPDSRSDLACVVRSTASKDLVHVVSAGSGEDAGQLLGAPPDVNPGSLFRFFGRPGLQGSEDGAMLLVGFAQSLASGLE